MRPSKYKKKERTFNDLPDRQRAFAQFVSQGMSYVDAYFKAGYLAGRSPQLKNVKETAYRNSYILAHQPLIEAFIARNRALQYEPEDYSIDMVKSRMRQIMMGEIAVSVKKGNDNIMVFPSHKDMVSAGKLLFEVLVYEQAKPKASVGEFELDDDILDKSTSFLKEFVSKGSSDIPMIEDDNAEDKEEDDE